MQSFIRSCAKTYRNWIVENRQNRMMKYYEKKNYKAIPKLFKEYRDYNEITF